MNLLHAIFQHIKMISICFILSVAFFSIATFINTGDFEVRVIVMTVIVMFYFYLFTFLIYLPQLLIIYEKVRTNKSLYTVVCIIFPSLVLIGFIWYEYGFDLRDAPFLFLVNFIFNILYVRRMVRFLSKN